MKNMKASRRFLPAGMLCVLLLFTPLAPAVFTSCHPEPATINITMVADYSQILEALSRTNQSLTEKLSLVETALSQGFADSEEAGQMLSQALSTLTGTMEEKFDQIEAAVKSQTASLEIKLALIEAAVTGGFADAAAQQALILSALQSLKETTEERFAAIESAMKSQTASLESKLALIETAVKEGLTDETSEIELLQQAVYALIGTASERLQAIEKAVESQNTSLSAALALVELALDNRLADVNEAMDLLLQAVKKLDGTMSQKLGAVAAAVRSQTSGLETKLGLIDAAVKAGLADDVAQQQLLKSAIESLDGTLADQLALIEAAINSQTTSLSSKLELIGIAVEEGMADDKDAKVLIQQAVEALDGTLAENLSDINKAVCSQTLALWTKLGLIETALKAGLSDEKTALSQIGQTLSTSLKDELSDVLTALSSIDTTLNEKVTAALTGIFQEIHEQTDYITILRSIKWALYQLEEHIINGHEYVEMGDGLKWATCNVGATTPEGYGDYFAWGETSTKASYTSSNYFDINFSVYDSKKTKLDLTDDAARVNWGSTWRMPTNTEYSWLLDNTNCIWEWTDNYRGTGVKGAIVTSVVPGYEGNQIFFPAAGFYSWDYKIYDGSIGYYWSAIMLFSDFADTLSFNDIKLANGSIGNIVGYDRTTGLPVRPVSD
jgi:hypothetical protein